MAKVVDKRAFAGEFSDISLMGRGGVFSADELAGLAVDRRQARDIVDNSRIEHRLYHFSELPGGYDQFHLTYYGNDIQLKYVSPQGELKERRLVRGTSIAHLSAKPTNFFPNELVGDLLKMHARGAAQEEIYGHMREFYGARGRNIPDHGTVKTSMATLKNDSPDINDVRIDPKFPDANIFALFTEGEEFLRRMHIRGKLLDAAVGHYRRTTPYDMRYVLSYARMVGFAEASGTNKPAGPDEARKYFGEHRDSEWSLKFHTNTGSILVLAMDNATVDAPSRNAGVLSIRPIDRPASGV